MATREKKVANTVKEGVSKEVATAEVITVVEKNEVSILEELNPVEIIAKIDSELKSMKAFSSENWKCGTNNIAGMIIKDSKDLPGLVKLAGLIDQSRDQYVKGQEILGIESIEEFKVSGCCYDDIMSDIKKQVNILTYAEKVKELETLKNEWKEFITKEDRKKALIAKMAKSSLQLS
jgi:hypothetical protein